jgi:hypothetical protein
MSLTRGVDFGVVIWIATAFACLLLARSLLTGARAARRSAFWISSFMSIIWGAVCVHFLAQVSLKSILVAPSLFWAYFVPSLFLAVAHAIVVSTLFRGRRNAPYFAVCRAASRVGQKPPV